MEQLSAVAKPGLMISQTWPTSRERQGDTLKAVEIVLAEDFFEALQTVEIPYPTERKQIARLVADRQIPLTYTLARVLNENRLNLSDLHEPNRKKSYETVIACLDDAREVGAATVGVISGPGPTDPKQRQEALQKLADSLLNICQAAQNHPPVKMVIEPLDVTAHKKGTLGSTAEAIEVCHALRQNGFELKLCLDTAHVLLNGEDPLETLALAQPYLSEYHYCNCITDVTHPLFGDHHLPFGPPGVVNVAGIAQIMQKSLDLGFFNTSDRPPIFCEVLKRSQDDSVQVMRHCQTALRQAWQTCRQQ